MGTVTLRSSAHYITTPIRKHGTTYKFGLTGTSSHKVPGWYIRTSNRLAVCRKGGCWAFSKMQSKRGCRRWWAEQIHYWVEHLQHTSGSLVTSWRTKELARCKLYGLSAPTFFFISPEGMKRRCEKPKCDSGVTLRSCIFGSKSKQLLKARHQSSCTWAVANNRLCSLGDGAGQEAFDLQVNGSKPRLISWTLRRRSHLRVVCLSEIPRKAPTAAPQPDSCLSALSSKIVRALCHTGEQNLQSEEPRGDQTHHTATTAAK